MSKKIIEGYTSKQEVRASAWESYGEETVYQLACQVFKSRKLAYKVYGKDGFRKVRIILKEIKDD